jgi:hypothetical protein
MTSTKPPTSLPSEDIDLLVLAERTILFFRKYKWLFLSAIVLGLFAGYLNYLRLPKVYKSRMIARSYMLSNQDCILVLDNWNQLIKNNERDALASMFGISPETFGYVKQLKGNEIQKVFTANNPNGFYIDVFVTDNKVLDELQKGILNGFENVDYIKKQLIIKRENLTKLISEVQIEISKMDSTKSRVEQLLQGQSSHSTSMIVDISGINKQLIEMNEKLLSYQQDLKLTTAAYVLQGFNKFKNPDGPNLIVWLGLGLIAFLAIAYIYAVYHSLSAKLKARSKVI